MASKGATMETIKRKSGIRFREMIWINGKSIKSPIFRRKYDCIQWLAKQRSQKVENELYGDLQKLREIKTLEENGQEWLKSKEASGIAKSTLIHYASYLRVHIGPAFLKRDLKSIKKVELEAFQLRLRKSHNAKGTNLIITVLKTLFKEAVKEGFLIKSPAEFIKRFSEDNNHDAYWTRAEIDQFLKANYLFDFHDLFLMAINTGMRKGELAGLCWDRIDFARNQITVTRTRDQHGLKERTKTNLKRVIPMNDFTRTTLLDLHKRKSSSDYVFIRPNGDPIDTHHIYRDFGKAQKKAGMINKITFHDLRHTFASQFIMSGYSIYELQKILGHTNITMTTRYAHFSPEYLQKSMLGFGLGQLDSNGNSEPNHILTMRNNLLEKVVGY